jgi:hypothetical protein
MKILQNLPLEHIWLSQKAYIKKIAKLANYRKIYSTPMSSNELLPNQKHASSAKIQNYQRKIGLLLFAAIFIRPNITFAILRLAKFLNNSNSAYHKAADRALIYLYNILSVYISRSADNSLCALLNTPDSKSCACEHMVSHLKSGMRSGYLDCRSDP